MTGHDAGHRISVPAPVRTHLRCPRRACRRVLAETDGARLYLASCAMARKAILHCIEPDCDGFITWYPPATHADRS